MSSPAGRHVPGRISQERSAARRGEATAGAGSVDGACYGWFNSYDVHCQILAAHLTLDSVIMCLDAPLWVKVYTVGVK